MLVMLNGSSLSGGSIELPHLAQPCRIRLESAHRVDAVGPRLIFEHVAADAKHVHLKRADVIVESGENGYGILGLSF